jgi:hypothetical protein
MECFLSSADREAAENPSVKEFGLKEICVNPGGSFLEFRLENRNETPLEKRKGIKQRINNTRRPLA